MTTITSLPNEPLPLIFSNFDKLSHLAQCRLVCKTWKDPVEREMLGRTITISPNIAKMHSLYDFLQIDPTRTHLIKRLHFSPERPIYPVIIMDLLELIATSSIESITGHIWDTDFLEIFTDVVESSPNNLGKLKTLTLSYGESEPPIRLALHCRETIQTMELNFWNYYNGEGIDWTFMDRLNEFHHLTSFTLTAEIGNIVNLNSILDNCPHLQEFTLSAYLRQHRLDLNQKAVKSHLNLKTLKIDRVACSSFTIEYFLFKLINLENISINTACSSHYKKEDIIRIPKLIQGVPQKELIYTAARIFEIPDIAFCLEEAGYTIVVENKNAFHDDQVRVVF